MEYFRVVGTAATSAVYARRESRRAAVIVRLWTKFHKLPAWSSRIRAKKTWAQGRDMINLRPESYPGFGARLGTISSF